MPKKYMKHYNFFLLMKKKNGLIKDKVGIEDIEIRIIKWEKVWNDNRREREREREMIFATNTSRIELLRIIATSNPKSI